MKKFLLIFVGLVLAAQIGFAGGLVTNTNQSTSWTRMLVRDASTQIDAVFYNPAGLVKLDDGLHFSISNQTLFQKHTITSTYKYLNNGEYVGNISAPVFPGVYAAWKKGKLAVSVGFNPIGGGGGASFDNGLPSMEIGVSSLVPAMGGAFSMLGYGTPNGYSLDLAFKGTSVYFGLQAGISYELTENISLFAGARYVWAKNTYEGHMKDITLYSEGGAYGNELPAAETMGTISQTFAGIASQANAGGAGIQPIIDNGAGGLTLAQLEGAQVIDAATRAQIEGGLLAFGVSQAQIDAMTAEQIQGAYYGIGTEMTGRSATFGGLSVVLADQEADVTQTGNGITPIVGANFSFMENKLNFGVKYEFKTKMDLTNSVADNKGFVTDLDPTTGAPIYMFEDGAKVNADIPAFLSIGAQYSIIDPLRIQLGFHTYFDKGADWAKDENGNEVIDKNFTEYGLGLEYDITEKFLISAGFLMARTGVNEYYQSDLSYSLSTNTIGGGFAYDINDKFTVQLGGFYTSYLEQTYDYTHSFETASGVESVNYQNTYDKLTYAFSIGVDIHL